MNRLKLPAAAFCAVAMLTASPALTAAEGKTAHIAPMKTDAPAGVYTLDKPHASVLFHVSHLGFSHFTGRFSHYDATLTFDPAHPSRSRVDATIDPASLETDNPPSGFLDLLRGGDWLDAAKYPKMSFRSTRLTLTSPDTARITGLFTLHGVTKPLVLDAAFNGGYAGNRFDPHARIGFSAHGAFKRSDYGMSFGLPPPGTKMGVGDQVEIVIETEFSGPAWSPPKAESASQP